MMLLCLKIRGHSIDREWCGSLRIRSSLSLPVSRSLCSQSVSLLCSPRYHAAAPKVAIPLSDNALYSREHIARRLASSCIVYYVALLHPDSSVAFTVIQERYGKMINFNSKPNNAFSEAYHLL